MRLSRMRNYFARSPRVGYAQAGRREYEMFFDQGEISSRLIGLAQREDVLVWHNARYARTQLPRGKRVDSARDPAFLSGRR